MKKEPYTCIRCGYATHLKGDIYKHLYKLNKSCPATKNDVELTDEIKDYILANRMYRIPKEEPNNSLKLELQYYKNRKNEAFYQMLIEKYLGGTHKYLSCGITDVTTNDCHAEIKEWKSWKEAVGQLSCYNRVDPKEKLQLYFFGSCSKKCKEEAINISLTFGFEVFEFLDEENEIKIKNSSKNEIVYVYKPN